MGYFYLNTKKKLKNDFMTSVRKYVRLVTRLIENDPLVVKSESAIKLANTAFCASNQMIVYEFKCQGVKYLNRAFLQILTRIYVKCTQPDIAYKISSCTFHIMRSGSVLPAI
jgi:hypothetical protein